MKEASAKKKTKSIARALGASRTFKVPIPSPHGPFGVMHLAEEVERRLKPGKGRGRPTDEELTIRRLVGFKPEVWEKLARISGKISKRTHHKVSPAQLASIIIEERLELSGEDEGEASVEKKAGTGG